MKKFSYNSKNVVVSVIYPNVVNDFKACLNSLENQSCSDFSLIVFNDGVELDQLNELLGRYTFESFIEPCAGTPVEIRQHVIHHLSTKNINNVIFVDADDTQTTNRVSDSIELLKSSDAVTFDVNVMSNNDAILQTNIWSERYKNKAVVSDNLLHCNMLGFSTTSIKASILKQVEVTNTYPIADWQIFYQLCKDKKVLFCNTAQCNYRQHAQNIIGYKSEDAESLKFKIEVCIAHLKFFDQTNNKIPYLKKLLEVVSSNVHLRCRLLEYINQATFNFFWWEQPIYIIQHFSKILDNESTI